jgi:hypothetical protein
MPLPTAVPVAQPLAAGATPHPRALPPASLNTALLLPLHCGVHGWRRVGAHARLAGTRSIVSRAESLVKDTELGGLDSEGDSEHTTIPILLETRFGAVFVI